MNRTKDSDFTGIDLRPVFREVVEKAVQLGWRVTRGETNQSLILSSSWHEGPPVTIVLPVKERSINAATLRGWYEKLTRYAKPDTVQAVAEGTAKPAEVKIEEPLTASEIDLQPAFQEAVVEAEKAEKVAKVEKAKTTPENLICRLCDPPTTWGSPTARGAHMKVHRGEGRRSALELIMVTAQEALGVAYATPAEVDELRAQLKNEQTAHRTTVDALEAARRENEKLRAKDGELRAALELLRGALAP